MSFPKLCPFCENNCTCRPNVPIVVMTHDQARQLPKEACQVEVPVTGYVIQNVACAVIGNAIDTAIRDGAVRLVLVVAHYVSNPEIEMLASTINCRAILKLNHEVKQQHSLKEILIVCEPQQVEYIEKGLAKSHPLCLGCFEKHD